MKKHIQGVYGIFNEVNGRVYVGASRNVLNRFQLHDYYLRRGNSSCTALQKDYDLGHHLTYAVLEIAYPNKLGELELKWIGKFPFAYNKRKYIHGVKPGKRLSVETRGKMSKARKGVPKPETMRKRLSESRMGIEFSQKTRTKMSRSAKGRTPWNKGKKMSAAYCKAASLCKLGKKASPETRKRMTDSQKARWAKR